MSEVQKSKRKAAIIDHYPAADEIEFFKKLFGTEMVRVDIICADFACQKFAVLPFYAGESMDGYEKL